MRSVGAPSSLDFPVARGPSDATRACKTVSPAMAQEPFFIVARGPVPRDRTRAPVTVVRDLIPNRSRLLGIYARASDDLALQRREKLSVSREPLVV